MGTEEPIDVNCLRAGGSGDTRIAAAEGLFTAAAGVGLTRTVSCVVEAAEGGTLPLIIDDDAPGATHLVQIVDVEVTSLVDSTVETCWMGVPPGGVIVPVTGQDVTVV